MKFTNFISVPVTIKDTVPVTGPGSGNNGMKLRLIVIFNSTNCIKTSANHLILDLYVMERYVKTEL